MKKSPTKKLWEKITKENPIVSNSIDPDKILKGHPAGKTTLDIISGTILDEEKKKPGKRKQFSKLTKKSILEAQRNRCKICGKKSKVWDFDHANGDKTNNDISNCQALCPNCHAEKTRRT